MAYDIKTGNLLGEIEMADAKYDIENFTVKIAGNDVHIFLSAYHLKKGSSLGYGHVVADKLSFKEKKREYILYQNLTEAIPGVSEVGRIGDNILMAQDFIITPQGNVLMIAEAFTTQGKFTLSDNKKAYALLQDLYLIEFEPDNKIAFTKKLKKTNTVEIPAGVTSYSMWQHGIFDYKFFQQINKKGDFILLYTSNDQSGSKRKVSKDALLTLGIISNVLGAYNFEILPLYGENKKIYPSIAKNGYIRLLEIDLESKTGEMRLEKINY